MTNIVTQLSDGEQMIKVLRTLQVISDSYGFKRLSYEKGKPIPESSKLILTYIIRNFRNVDIKEAFEYATISGVNLNSYGQILTITMLGQVLGNYRDYQRQERVRKPEKLNKSLPSGEVRKLNIDANLKTLNEILEPKTIIKTIHYRLIDGFIETFSDKMKVDTYKEILNAYKQDLSNRVARSQKEYKTLSELRKESNVIIEAKKRAQIKLAKEWIEENRDKIYIEMVKQNIMNK